MLYSSAGVLALIITLIINYDMLKKDDKSGNFSGSSSYRTFVLVVSGYYITDILWGLLYERQLIGLTFADTVLYFIAMAFSILMWVRFVVAYLGNRSTYSKILTVSGCLIFSYQIIVVFVNLFTPVLYWFDAEGIYHAGIGRYINLVLQILLFAMIAVYVFNVAINSTGTTRKRHVTIGLFSLAMTGFIAAQAFFPLLPMYTIGCLLGICVLHSFVLETEHEEQRDDVEEELRESIRKGHYFDGLTNLPSMTYFFELADLAKQIILDKGGQPAVLYMDFSGMKFFNRKYGFTVGDKLLKDFAEVLTGVFGQMNCCRVVGDHFIVITETAGVEERLNQVFDACRKINSGKSLPVHVGIYNGEMEDLHVSVACDRAKLACGEQKSIYSSCFNYYNQTLSDKADQKQYIIENIDKAIRGKWIQVYYQPIVRAANRKICNEEALARWVDLKNGFLLPDTFIPTLEEAGLIYKVDLCVLEQVLEKMKQQKLLGMLIVPNSINLSRSDFYTCDIVEEIRRRVDASGIDRSCICLEITESVIGGDYDFMSERISKLRELGFQVWMDDFGSGYSSLDILETLKFDLIKFDMAFMRRLDEGKNGKIILTQMMQMATALGLETICEGVETEEQARFLQEIGCTKLQGYYFSRPVPLTKVLERCEQGMQPGVEDPADAQYYEVIGRVNLHDLSSIINEEDSEFRHVYNMLPMAIIEISHGKAEYIRSNQSYRDFMNHFFDFDITNSVFDYSNVSDKHGPGFVRALEQCCTKKSHVIFDEKMPDDSLVHGFMRKISQSEIGEKTAVAIGMLSITDPDEGATYAEIARVLASDYYHIYVVNLDTENFIEYTSPVGKDDLAEERHGTDFFATARRDTQTRIYEDDRAPFLAVFTKENVVRELDERGIFTSSYRLIDTGEPLNANMKISRMSPGSNRIILGVSLVE